MTINAHHQECLDIVAKNKALIETVEKDDD